MQLVYSSLEHCKDGLVLDMRAPLYVAKSERKTDLQDSTTQESSEHSLEGDHFIPSDVKEFQRKTIRLGAMKAVDNQTECKYQGEMLLKNSQTSELLDLLFYPHIMEYAEIADSIYRESGSLYDKLGEQKKGLLILYLKSLI